MKRVFGLLILSFFIKAEIFGQCPPSVLKVETGNCQPPYNLKGKAFTCDSIGLSWQSKSIQKFLVKITSSDSAGNLKLNSEYIIPELSNNGGHYYFSTAVPQVSKASWSVQALCKISDASVYSLPVQGNQILLPVCNSFAATDNSAAQIENSRDIIVFPNPAYQYLVVEQKIINDNFECTVTDASGKMLLRQSYSAGTDRFIINTSSMLAGSYTLNIVTRSKTVHAKFVKLVK